MHVRRGLLAVTAFATVASMTVVAAGPAEADHGISTTASVAMRGSTSNSAGSNGTIPSGTSPTYLCWTRGDNVGD